MESFPILLLLLLSVAEDICAEEDAFCSDGHIMDPQVCLPNDYFINDRPEKLTNVEVGFEIIDFPGIDDNAILTMTLSLYIVLKWKEPRLVTNFTDAEMAENKRIPLSIRSVDFLWKPDLFISNLVEYKEHAVLDPMSGLAVFPGNLLEYWVTASVTVSCTMGFHIYPMDSQECPFYVQSSNYDNTRVFFTSYYTYDPASNRLQEFDLLITGIPHDDKELLVDGYMYSRVGFVVHMDRFFGPFVLKYYIPCFSMVLICFMSFAIPAEAIPGRVALLSSLYLVLSTFFGDIQATTPQSEGLTALQVYVLTCLMFAFACTQEYAFILAVLKRHHHRVHIINMRRREAAEFRRNQMIDSDDNIFTTTSTTKLKVGRARAKLIIVEDRGKFSWHNLRGDIEDPESFAYDLDRRAAILFFVLFLLFNLTYVIYFAI